MTSPTNFIKVPKERVAILIGPNGAVRTHIEEKLNVKLKIDSETGDVQITLNPEAPDPTALFRAKDIVTAIGRGFSPEHAYKLLDNEETILEIIDLHETIGKSEADLKRLKGRVIGKEGRTRSLIEELTETNVSIYGHTISIIGGTEQVEIAKQAIRMLLRGSLHSTVYRFLHKKRRDLKKKKLEIWKPAGERFEE
ncbi:MAG TPA: KH domain-containing protein [Candidatus Krumholzibacteriaceae bacterium]|jgi:ribosomal RNA assembly protein|nr:KH domain-containing protein [Candidatus Krumholzibacteriaceae bacterium]